MSQWVLEGTLYSLNLQYSEIEAGEKGVIGQPKVQGDPVSKTKGAGEMA